MSVKGLVPGAGLEPAHLAAGDFESHSQLALRLIKTRETFRICCPILQG